LRDGSADDTAGSYNPARDTARAPVSDVGSRNRIESQSTEGRSSRDQTRGADSKNSWAYEVRMRASKSTCSRGIRSARRSREDGRPSARSRACPLTARCGRYHEESVAERMRYGGCVSDRGRGRPSLHANGMSAGRQPNVKRGARLFWAGGALPRKARMVGRSLPPAALGWPFVSARLGAFAASAQGLALLTRRFATKASDR
jgi:hypothetical protein